MAPSVPITASTHRAAGAPRNAARANAATTAPARATATPPPMKSTTNISPTKGMMLDHGSGRSNPMAQTITSTPPTTIAAEYSHSSTQAIATAAGRVRGVGGGPCTPEGPGPCAAAVPAVGCPCGAAKGTWAAGGFPAGCIPALGGMAAGDECGVHSGDECGVPSGSVNVRPLLRRREPLRLTVL